MDIDAWLKERRNIGTVAGLARVTAVSNADHADVERELRLYIILEALIANDGNHAAAAKALGAHRHTIARCLRDLGITSWKVRELATTLKSNGGK